MRMIFGLVLIVGIALAGTAAYMVKGYLATTTAERNALLAAQARVTPTAGIIVMNTDKAYGELLTPEDVVTVRWQQNSLPEGHFSKMEDLFPEGADPRMIITNMAKFEPVLQSKITDPGGDANSSIISRLGNGMRAFAINVDLSSGVSGLLRPGDKVDIYWTGNANGRPKTVRLETNIELIAVDQSTDARSGTNAGAARTVTVAISPKQVASLAQAQSTGRLSLSLVGVEDDSPADALAVDQDTLFAEPTEEVCYMMVQKGGERVQSNIPVECRN